MRTTECLTELVEYWHEYDTERVKQYVQNERGWAAEMVDEFLLGWASPDAEPYHYLRNQGYEHKEILSTGAFTSDARPLWNGRYVFPYFNEDREVVYAIARATGEGGGAAGYDGHPEDFLAGKYAKLAHTKDYVHVNEPIWGQHTLSQSNGSVIITEGIADAMSVDYAQAPVLSPVTTSFKDEHYDPLISVCEEHSIDTVYIIPDAEEVQRKAKYGVSVGLQGALTSAYKIYNRTNEIEVRVAELPRQSGEKKVDVDSYLASHSIEDLGSLLQSAREATEFDAYEDIALDTASKEYEDSFQGIESENHSAIYDLDIDNVLPANFSGRGKNPIEHTGTSTAYFVSGSESAYDHKLKVGYNALTYLLCKFGIRDAANPNGSLSDEEIYELWYNAKETGIIAETDSIPVRGMKHVAQELGYDVADYELLPRGIYNEVIEEVDERVDSGRDKLEKWNSQKEFYADKSAYYRMDVDIVNTVCDAYERFDGFKSDEYMWTADGVYGWVPSLALVAIEEGYIGPDDAISRWTSKLTDTQFAELCLTAQNEYLFGGKPPYRALVGVAKERGYSINPDGTLTTQSKQKAKRVFYS